MTTSGYQLRRVSGPELEPVTLEEAKRQCRVDSDLTDEHDDFEFWIGAARELVEELTKRTLCESTWELALEDFPRCGYESDLRIQLPMGTPLVRVESVSYLNASGERVALNLSEFQVAQDEPAFIAPPSCSVWPSALRKIGSVRVTYVAGYVGAGSPAGVEAVPKRARQAIRMLVAHWYENREAINIGNIVNEIPLGWADSLASLRVYP